MIKQGSLEELRSGVIKKSDGWLCLTTRYYPRFLKPGEIDEYVSDLAPTKKLLTEFKNKSARLGHDEAFEAIGYQLKFTLNEKGHAHLKMLTELGKDRDVFILCYCARGLYCHRELLLLLARDRYGAQIGPLTHAYPDFLKRIKDV